MLTHVRQIPNEVLEPIYRASVDELMKSPVYGTLAQQTASIMARPATARAEDHPRPEIAVLMPVAYFGIRSTVRTLGDPNILPQVPLEVERRRELAQQCSSLMILLAANKGILQRYYASSPHLAAAYREGGTLRRVLTRPEAREHLGALGKVAILDAGIVAGGALRYLRRDRPDILALRPPAETISNSTGLQIVGRVPDAALARMRRRLGLPYTGRQHLQATADNLLEFKPAAQAFIRSLFLPGRGCPAFAAHANKISLHSNFFQLAWTELAGVLVPPDAIASDIPKRRSTSKK
jgi:hypothetical protein